MASRGFSTTAMPEKMSPSDCDNDRKPEMAIDYADYSRLWVYSSRRLCLAAVLSEFYLAP